MSPKNPTRLLAIGLLFGAFAIPGFGQAQGQGPGQNQNPNQGGQGGGFGGGQGGGGFGGGGQGGGGFGGGGPGGPGGQGGPGGGRGGLGQFMNQNGQIDPAMVQQLLQQLEQRQLDNIKQALDASDDEFMVLQPKILKLLELQFSTTITQYSGQIPTGGAGGPGGQGGPGGGGQGGPGGGGRGGFMAIIQAALPPNDLQAAASALKMVLDDKDSTPALVAAKLAEYRAAKITANDQLVEAQNDFKSLLTQRQEGAMVLQGLIN